MFKCCLQSSPLSYAHSVHVLDKCSNSKSALSSPSSSVSSFSFSVLVGSRSGQGQQHFRAVLPHSRGLFCMEAAAFHTWNSLPSSHFSLSMCCLFRAAAIHAQTIKDTHQISPEKLTKMQKNNKAPTLIFLFILFLIFRLQWREKRMASPLGFKEKESRRKGEGKQMEKMKNGFSFIMHFSRLK